MIVYDCSVLFSSVMRLCVRKCVGIVCCEVLLKVCVLKLNGDFVYR